MNAGEYTHLLVAVDFEPESEVVVARAQRLRHLTGARLTLLHVIEHIPPSMEYLTLGYSGEIALPENRELEAELLAVAVRQMDELGEQLDVAAPDRLVRVGATGHVIDDVAEELGADLVILGRHGRHGLLGLFGSTARTVLRHSTCDVLCVKIDEGST
ncbi:universal stress protein [Thiocystis violascens]|uniref:Universal stress protein n=1 Tax=Thiocystis violascens (strain ATCC 17096 / DSM 198 / 6111) TaxID=765911 RepID=I3Y784_THIV6|nr:universal stress protein [Thiocystis violascens]AFL72852.1 universal stress protein UspA-like protein [Thiocystis violascens DSM 198]